MTGFEAGVATMGGAWLLAGVVNAIRIEVRRARSRRQRRAVPQPSHVRLLPFAGAAIETALSPDPMLPKESA